MQHKYVMINKNIKLAEKYYTINYIWIKKQFYEVIRYTKLIFYIVNFHLRQKRGYMWHCQIYSWIYLNNNLSR